MSKGINGFVGKLAVHDLGVVILCNILDGHAEGLYDVGFVRELMDWWAGLYVWRIKTGGRPNTKPEECELILGSLNLLLFQPQPPSFRPGRKRPDFLLRISKSLTIDTMDLKYLHVLKSVFVFDIFFTPTATKRVSASGSMALHREPGIKRKISKAKLDSTDFNLGQVLGRDGEVVFLTLAEGLKKIIGKPNMASMARDVLGLAHHEEGVELVALGFHCPSVGQSNHARPTFADAGGHRRFKAVADNAVNKADKTWGFAVDLERFEQALAELDGLPERVARPIAFKDMENIDLYFLGKVAGTRGVAGKSGDDSGFERRLRGARSEADIKLAIQGIL